MLLILASCSSEQRPQLPPAVDAAVDAPAGLELGTSQGAIAMTAWYSMFLEPLDGPDGGTTVQLVVTLVDASYTCSGGKPQGVDVVAFAFGTQNAPASSMTIIARGGPHLGSTLGGSGQMDLSFIDDRYQGERDGGPDVAPGGRADGQVQWTFADHLSVMGSFSASYCPALDFVLPP